jgi:hypothetical protein
VILHTCERKNLFRGNDSCVVLLRNVQVPRRNSDSHLVCCDPSQLRAKKRKLAAWNLFRGKLAAWNLEYCKRNVLPRTIPTLFAVILHTCVRKNVFRGKLATWNLEFCNSYVVSLRNVQVPRRNSDSHLVCCDPSQLRAKKRI